MVIKHLLKISAASVTYIAAFCTFQSNALAEGYRLPFPAGKSVYVTQSCIDEKQPDCEHSKEGNNYSLSQKYAIDFGCNIGDSIVAIQGGLVNFIDDDNGYNDGYGNLIKLQHSDNRYSLYAHLQSVNPFNIGASILQGQEIGKCGNTGNSSGPHLHLELRSGKSLVQGQVSTERIYFDECKNNPNCIKDQVVDSRTYTSLNGSSSTNNNSSPPIVPIIQGQIRWDLVNLKGTNFDYSFSIQPLFSGATVVAVNNGTSSAGLNRRNAPAGQLIGIQDIPWGAYGKYTGESAFAMLDEDTYNWLNIDWGKGKTGYSAEPYLYYQYTPRKMQFDNFFNNNSDLNNQTQSNSQSVNVPEPSSILGILFISVSSMLVRLKKKIS
ncbi:peptidoglycan DD-metalloendopeptidase family protein [Anabaena cylindrica UHCC 0172]|uniref:peptidoglycan DD-metalloendopeptidase family protein n=1 Tax=Anabaena cylindrica TaxID=1165 RepID=UPI002B20C06D|nr:peptidoglycan DD-metalloendopeptidase family protein [Anabaena cylindrica]MEA5553643.1 peptidoglycan DD-metalloendopeptidase family protein [Anabaena cylindrica UHCC 0172]